MGVVTALNVGPFIRPLPLLLQVSGLTFSYRLSLNVKSGWDAFVTLTIFHIAFFCCVYVFCVCFFIFISTSPESSLGQVSCLFYLP